MTPLHCAYSGEHKWTPTGVAIKTWTSCDTAKKLDPDWCDVEEQVRCEVCGLVGWMPRRTIMTQIG